MNIEKLDQLLKHDLTVTPENMIEASLTTPLVHSRWIKLFTQQESHVVTLRQRMAKLRKAKFEFYTGKAPAHMYEKNPFNLKLTKTEVQSYIDADDMVQELERELVHEEGILTRIHEATKAIAFRGRDIKNAIDWQKFLHGEH